MKILHCLHNYFPARGGAEWLMQNISEKLTQRGHETKVIATNAYSVEDYFLPGKGKKLISEDEEIINGVHVKRVPFSRRSTPLLYELGKVANRVRFPFSERLRMLSWGPRSRAYRRETLNSDGFDLIAACPLPTLNIRYAWKAAKKNSLPLVIIPCFHTEDPWSFRNRHYFRMLKEADAVITLTDWEKEYLVNEGIMQDKIHTIGAGIDISSNLPEIDIRRKYGITQEQIVLFLGQHGAHKGILDLIWAMQFVWPEKKDIALVIAGNPTAHTGTIERVISELKKEEKSNVYLIKSFPEEEKRAFLKTADIFTSVSAFESFGIVFLEAWRDKVPVIGCRRGASARLIDEFKDGLEVHYGNIKELAGAIVELLDGSETRKRMGEAGYKKVVENHLWDRIALKWEKVYDDTIRSHRKIN